MFWILRRLTNSNFEGILEQAYYFEKFIQENLNRAF